MKLNPSEANSSTSGNETLHILGNPKVKYQVHTI